MKFRPPTRKGLKDLCACYLKLVAINCSEIDGGFVWNAHDCRAVIPFDWPHWEGMQRFADDEASIDQASLVDCLRLFTAIIRSERFCEGSLSSAAEGGQLTRLIIRLAAVIPKTKAELDLAVAAVQAPTDHDPQ